MNAKSQIANVITFMSLALGIIAIILALRDFSIYWVAGLILVAGLLDRFDGKVARYFDAESSFGEQIDSFNDIISFGIAPMIMFCQYHQSTNDLLAIFIVMLYLFAGVYRLARFHIFEINDYYIGLPITVAALIAVILMLLHHALSLPQLTVIIAFILLSLLMIMPYKIKKR